MPGACVPPLLRDRALERFRIFVSTQVLQELYVSLTKGRDPIATPDVAGRAVREAAAYAVVQVDTPLVLSAVEACRRHHQLSFWDTLILRAAAQAGCGVVLTEDLNAGQFDGVRVENPFA